MGTEAVAKAHNALVERVARLEATAPRERVMRLAGEMESILAQAARAWAGLAADLSPTWDEIEREMVAKDPTYATSTERAAIQWAQEQCGVDPPEHRPRPSAEGDRIVAAANSPESTSTLCNGEGECSCRGFVCECDRPMAETIDSLVVGPYPYAKIKVDPSTLPRASEFIQSEREHPAPPSPAFDPRAATETCAHSGCRRKAFAKLTNIEGDHWLSCAEHYEQDLAAQARADGHEPAWRVPIGPGVVLERWRGGPIGVKVDGELRCYVTAGELARIFEGPVA
jgi:hypothetical protein